MWKQQGRKEKTKNNRARERKKKEKVRNLQSNRTKESSHAKWWHERLRDFHSRMILYRRIWLDKKETNSLKHWQNDDVTLLLSRLILEKRVLVKSF